MQGNWKTALGTIPTSIRYELGRSGRRYFKPGERFPMGKILKISGGWDKTVGLQVTGRYREKKRARQTQATSFDLSFLPMHKMLQKASIAGDGRLGVGTILSRYVELHPKYGPPCPAEEKTGRFHREVTEGKGRLKKKRKRELGFSVRSRRSILTRGGRN